MTLPNPVAEFAESAALVTVRESLLVGRSFLAQHDGLYSEVVGARYAAEMASARPQVSNKIAEDTHQYVQRLGHAVLQLDQFRGVIQKTTGHAVEQLRARVDVIGTLLGRHDAVKAELMERLYLTPVMAESIVNTPAEVRPTAADHEAAEDAAQAAEKLSVAMAEVPYMRANLAALAAAIQDVAAALVIVPFGDAPRQSTLLTLGER